MFLITGATGTVGSEVVASLQHTHPGRVRALTRNANAVFPSGVNKVVADLSTDDLTAVLDGVDGVFLVSDGVHIADRDQRVAAAAAAAGVQRIVKLSALGVGHGSTDPITNWHRAGEEAIRVSGLSWTFLRPTAFMSNALNWAPDIARDRVVRAPFAAGRTAVVDPADIGAVAAASLTDGFRHEAIYEITGPDPLSPGDQVAILSDVLGRTLSFVEVDHADVLAQMTSHGMPTELARAIVELMRSSREPFNSQPTGDIQSVTGRPARSFVDWVRAHRAAFVEPTTGW